MRDEELVRLMRMTDVLEEVEVLRNMEGLVPLVLLLLLFVLLLLLALLLLLLGSFFFGRNMMSSYYGVL